MQKGGKIAVDGGYKVSGLFDYDAVLLRFTGSGNIQKAAKFDGEGDGKADVSGLREERNRKRRCAYNKYYTLSFG